jgi:hypothetical protein
MKYLWFITAALFTSACTHSEHSFETYIKNKQERDSLVVDIISYVYAKPPAATSFSRFEDQYRQHYVSQFPNFRIDKYYVDSDRTHWFLMMRPARTSQGRVHRYVGGKMKITDGSIAEFREVFVTIAGKEEEIKEKALELWKEMLRYGNVDRYMDHRHYLEWPDPNTHFYYNTEIHEWAYMP